MTFELVTGIKTSNANAVGASTEFLEVVMRRTRRGYFATAQGVDADGNAWESDDVGPFASRDEAKAAALETE